MDGLVFLRLLVLELLITGVDALSNSGVLFGVPEKEPWSRGDDAETRPGPEAADDVSRNSVCNQSSGCIWKLSMLDRFLF